MLYFLLSSELVLYTHCYQNEYLKLLLDKGNTPCIGTLNINNVANHNEKIKHKHRVRGLQSEKKLAVVRT